MWFWKNNGPRPPTSNDDALIALASVCIVFVFVRFVQIAFIGGYQAYTILREVYKF